MESIWFIVLVLGIAIGVNANDCLGKPDGEVVNWGCRWFSQCQGGYEVIIDCSLNGEVFDQAKLTCDDPLEVPYPCGLWRDCSGLEDRKYVDPYSADCTEYFTCHNGYFYGHNKCLGGTVFDEAMQLCNWPSNVAPPCGTAGTE